MKKLEDVNIFETNIIKRFINAGFHKYKPFWGWERECDHCSLYFISEGSLKFILKAEEFMAEKGDVVFLKENDNAYIENVSETQSSLYFIAYYPNTDIDFNIDTVTRNTPYENIFRELLNAHLSKATFSNIKILQLFLRLIYSLAADKLHSDKGYITTSKINSTAEYININYYKNITVESLCKISGYSPAHLRRMFIKTFGVSPQNYIINKRIEMAKEMLLDIPRKNIDEIADMLGLCSSSYFCKIFKEKTGLSPLEYRTLNNNR